MGIVSLGYKEVYPLRIGFDNPSMEEKIRRNNEVHKYAKKMGWTAYYVPFAVKEIE